MCFVFVSFVVSLLIARGVVRKRTAEEEGSEGVLSASR